MKLPVLILLLSFFLVEATIFAQKTKAVKADTLQVDSVKFHSPTKATIMSMALPGLGQVYNKKYWKVPIVYAGIGTSLYFGMSNNKNYNEYKTAYITRIDGGVEGPEFENISDENLLSSIDYYKRNRDLSYIVAGLFYVFNIVDASVDAHLFTFPKNDNLSFNIQPTLQYTQNNKLTKGLSLVIKL